MSSEPVVAKKKLPVLKLVIGALVLGTAAIFLLRGVNVREIIERGMEVIRNAGPVVFFCAMAVLPGLGVPSLTFMLTAGPVFGETLGMPWVVILCLLASTVNLVVTYALARRALRPFFETMMKRLGYKIPEVDEGDLTGLTIVMRVTPGIPFFVQNYLLGIAGVPVVKYLAISCPVTWIYGTGFVLFGDALLNGKGKMIFIAVSLLVVAAVITHTLRRHYAKKKTADGGAES
jgi:uncharacterized membrane protein YdjX (TVP38/TMEM64 family)